MQVNGQPPARTALFPVAIGLDIGWDAEPVWLNTDILDKKDPLKELESRAHFLHFIRNWYKCVVSTAIPRPCFSLHSPPVFDICTLKLLGLNTRLSKQLIEHAAWAHLPLYQLLSLRPSLLVQMRIYWPRLLFHVFYLFVYFCFI